ncbi:MAG: hypothetical protein H0X39_00515 [Actinobacteria bacterium]|nr:hypothetical protein [Actinomycetota bacterium]
MGALTPTILMDLESRMEVLTENEYTRLTSNLWWQIITRTRTTTSRRDVLTWLLTTASIKSEGKGGNIAFDDLVAIYTELEVLAAGAGLRLRRFQLEDTDGNGIDLAAEWSAQIGAFMAYWPQQQVANFLMTAQNTGVFTGYDQLPFFANNHPVNPYDTGRGVFANLMTGAANSAFAGYPGALPIDDTVTADVALSNLSRLYSYIASIKMPNGVTPRFLRPKAIICSPRVFPRVTQIMGAKFLAQAAGSSAASADVEGFVKSMGYSMPVQADELAGFENDTTYFVACETIGTSRLGAVLYTQREPFHINYYGPQQQADLDRRDELEWHCKGRNAVSPGHPYLLFKVKGS